LRRIEEERPCDWNCGPQQDFEIVREPDYREWSGYYAVSVYETHHEHEYNAIRNAAALIDVERRFSVSRQRQKMRRNS